jgi:hypothetical protein
LFPTKTDGVFRAAFSELPAPIAHEDVSAEGRRNWLLWRARSTCFVGTSQFFPDPYDAGIQTKARIIQEDSPIDVANINALCVAIDDCVDGFFEAKRNIQILGKK